MIKQYNFILIVIAHFRWPISIWALARVIKKDAFVDGWTDDDNDDDDKDGGDDNDDSVESIGFMLMHCTITRLTVAFVR